MYEVKLTVVSNKVNAITLFNKFPLTMLRCFRIVVYLLRPEDVKLDYLVLLFQVNNLYKMSNCLSIVLKFVYNWLTAKCNVDAIDGM